MDHYCYVSLLPDDLKAKVMMAMDIEDLIQFRETYPDSDSTEHEKDIIRHFYVKYNLPRSNTFIELLQYFNSTYVGTLKVIVERDDVDDFVRIMGDNKINSTEMSSFLLSSAVSSKMMKIILDYSSSYSLYFPVLSSDDPELIRYLVNKFIEQYGYLGNVRHIMRLLGKKSHIEGKTTAIDILLEYSNDVTYVIIGAIEEDNIQLAKKYIDSNYDYDFADIINLLGYYVNLDKFVSILDMLPRFTAQDASNVIHEDYMSEEVNKYLMRRYNL